jgi:hypothetical protein
MAVAEQFLFVASVCHNRKVLIQQIHAFADGY